MVTLIITNFTTGKKSRSTLNKTFEKAEAVIKRRLDKLAQNNNRFDAVVYGDGQQIGFTESDF
ncbi:hypothetical protein [Pseudoalteromonas tunicata]|nr:hypothetical protein [Pseudoalteromonas tunicata]ATC93831.1 hypothetical protein PTUN_a1159 [Pseudoalteromonas tunicata]AXT29646.1 hypothetical protein D1819_01630 [Pseudoalteromonas tunicata]